MLRNFARSTRWSLLVANILSRVQIGADNSVSTRDWPLDLSHESHPFLPTFGGEAVAKHALAPGMLARRRESDTGERIETPLRTAHRVPKYRTASPPDVPGIGGGKRTHNSHSDRP